MANLAESDAEIQGSEPTRRDPETVEPEPSKKCKCSAKLQNSWLPWSSNGGLEHGLLKHQHCPVCGMIIELGDREPKPKPKPDEIRYRQARKFAKRGW